MRPILAGLMTIAVLAFGANRLAAQTGAGQSQPGQATPEKRIAFVIGNESYAAGALPTAANDAGLVAQTLQAAGFDVVGARDLDAETLRQSYADFLKRINDAGPNTAAFIYLAGYGLQYGNDNYFVPIGATLSKVADIPIESIRLSDLTGPLAAAHLKASFLVFDGAYKTPFAIEGAAVAGFSLVDPTPGTLIAYNSAPGTVAPVGKGNYGVYAQSLAAELREGGLTPDEIFDRLRLRVGQTSKGAEIPWDASKIDAAFRFFNRDKGAPAPVASADQQKALTSAPLATMPANQAFSAALARDTVASYSAFNASFGGDPLAKRARVLLAVRREELTWRRTVSVDTPAAYWSYLSRYPKGPHAASARLRLEGLSAALSPPPDYQAIAYDVPPPPPDEAVYAAAPVVYFDDPGYDFPPPPPPPDYWLPPVPVDFLDLPPPPPPYGLFFLPIPAFVPLPAYYDPPPYVAYPANNYFFGGYGGGVPYERNVFINNRTVVNNIHTSFPGGGPRNAAAPGGRATAAVPLPNAAQQRTENLQRRGITTPEQLRAARSAPGGLTGAATGAGTNALPGRQLPAGQVTGGQATGGQVTGGQVRRNEAVPADAARRGAAGTPTAGPAASAVRGNAAANAANAARDRRALQAQQRQQRLDARRAQTVQRAQAQRGRALAARAPAARAARAVARPQVRAPVVRRGPPAGFAGPRGGGFAGPRPGGFAAPRAAAGGGFAGPRPGPVAAPRMAAPRMAAPRMAVPRAAPAPRAPARPAGPPKR